LTLLSFKARVAGGLPSTHNNEIQVTVGALRHHSLTCGPVIRCVPRKTTACAAPASVLTQYAAVISSLAVMK
jgi:hypothetical protein